MIWTNKYNLPEAIVNAIINDDYDSGGADITATSLLKPVRARAIELMHADELTRDVSQNLYSLLGQAIHHILEKAETKARVEERYFIQVNGWKVGAKFDRLLVTEQLLADYKCTAVRSIKDGGKEEWEQQLNILAYVLGQNGFKVSKLEINAILRDHMGGKALSDKDYPPIPFVNLDLPLWSEEKQLAFITKKVIEHQNASLIKNQDKLPLCTDRERWSDGPQFAVIKGVQKKAYRVFDLLADAQRCVSSAPPGYRTIERPSKSRRCGAWCDANKFCDQYKKELDELKETEDNRKNEPGKKD
jgi:hypothetical protein